jgi:fructose-1,6-bisphosphatase/inositol monophosphatase family enzyme
LPFVLAIFIEMTSRNMSRYKQFALELAEKAGQIIRNDFKLGMRIEWKADNTPLVKTDLVINQLVIDSVRKKFPGHSVLSEEGNYFSGESDYVWVCDPLDGTIPFSHGIPVCAFSLALVCKGESILGVVYDPFMDRMFFAEKGKGAFMNGKKISISSRNTFRHSLFSVVHWVGAPFNFSELATVLKNKGARISNVSIAYMGALVAAGEFTGTIFPGEQPNDTAAIKVLVEEAGGKVTDIFGNEQRYDRPIKGHITSNGIMHEKLLALVRETLGKERKRKRGAVF